LNVVAILLAAGSASRFGADKLLHALPHDVPIAVQAARQLQAVFADRVLAVVRPEAKTLAALLRQESCTVIECGNAAEGMAASLACGVAGAGDAQGFVVALADMPFIRASTIAAVRDALASGAPLAAPYFRARRGHPVGIAARFRDDIAALKGDEGARKIIAAHQDVLRKIPVGDPGVLRDIDTPEDLAPPALV